MDPEVFKKISLDSLKQYMSDCEGGIIDIPFANFINHVYGNVRTKEGIKQYIFFEGDSIKDVLDFIHNFYPRVWEELQDS